MSTFAERVMLRDVEDFATAPTSQALDVLSQTWKDTTAEDLIHAMRTGQDITLEDLACALAAAKSLRRAREHELTDDLLHGSHFAGAANACTGGCGA